MVDFSTLKASTVINMHVTIARKFQKYRVALKCDRVERKIVGKWTLGTV